MKTQIQKFLREEDGITALEYGVLAAVITAGVVIFAGHLNNWFTGLWSTIQSSINGAAGTN